MKAYESNLNNPSRWKNIHKILILKNWSLRDSEYANYSLLEWNTMQFGRLVLPKRWCQSTKLHGITYQKTSTFYQVEDIRIT
jgi:hypothetical protein